MWAYIGSSSHSNSINMFTNTCPTHLLAASGNSCFKKLKNKLSLEKTFFDHLHKPRLSLNLKNIISDVNIRADLVGKFLA